MSKKNPTAVPFGQFFGKYAQAIEQGQARDRRPENLDLASVLDLVEKGEQAAPRMIRPEQMWEAVRAWWPMRLVRQAAEEGDREGCKRLLHYFLLNLDVSLPKGVLIRFHALSGREDQTRPIHEAWVAQGRPVLTNAVCRGLARKFYAEELAKSRSRESQKRIVDRIRSTILRHELPRRYETPKPIS